MKKLFTCFLIFTMTGSLSLAAGKKTGPRVRCGSQKIDALDRFLIESKLQNSRASAKRFGFIGAREHSVAITVPVYFHVVNLGSRADQGNVDQSVFERQIEVLNETFKAVNVTFAIAEIDRTTNEKWVRAGLASDEDWELRGALHKGGAEALNIYTLAPSTEELGWSQYPWDAASYPQYDGVVVDFRSLPGGEFSEYNMGMTIVHEAGHWMGLFHTFEFGCAESSSDYVDDTPAEALANTGCPATAPDSCPNDSGVDPIHNYMDYSDDVCLYEFTAQQIQRMRDSYFAYRLPK